MPLPCTATTLSEIAEKIRDAKNSSERNAAIAAFRTICQNSPKGPLNPALEAANRNLVLVSPL